jgi:hypothetical protein
MDLALEDTAAININVTKTARTIIMETNEFFDLMVTSFFLVYAEDLVSLATTGCCSLDQIDSMRDQRISRYPSRFKIIAEQPVLLRVRKLSPPFLIFSNILRDASDYPVLLMDS